MTRRLIAKLLTFVLTLAAVAGFAGTAEAFPPGQGPGGPILVISDPSDPFDRYYAEILTAEGLNAFDVRNADQVSDATLSGYSVVILASDAPALASSLSAWVQGGGNLIAMRPGTSLAGLLGLGSDTGDLDNGYIRVNAGSGPGAGITAETMQFHDRADRWTIGGATRVADLYSNATTATTNPAVTLRSVGSAGGQAAAFTYDLARSVVQTRQGNPAWAGQKRDGQIDPIRSDDLFFPNWVNLDKVAIPQADEQQRLLANLVTQMSADRVPMPRFWYFPRGERAVVVMTGDDHQPDGTEAHFDRFLALSPPGCSVADWDCVRSTSYVYAINDMTAAQVAAYQAQGFEIALHLNTGCAQLHRGFAARELGGPASRLPGEVGGRRRGAAHQPHPLHRLERLGERTQGRPRVRDPAGHELLLLARHLGSEPARDVHGIRHPDAVRGPRRLADRRLPGDDADHRRVRDEHRGAYRRAARPGARDTGLLRRLHGEHAQRSARDPPAPTRSSPPPRRAACR